jgi:hypothetical protein
VLRVLRRAVRGNNGSKLTPSAGVFEDDYTRRNFESNGGFVVTPTSTAERNTDTAGETSTTPYPEKVKGLLRLVLSTPLLYQSAQPQTVSIFDCETGQSEDSPK